MRILRQESEKFEKWNQLKLELGYLFRKLMFASPTLYFIMGAE
jgi:hypothetical protein